MNIKKLTTTRANSFKEITTNLRFQHARTTAPANAEEEQTSPSKEVILAEAVHSLEDPK